MAKLAESQCYVVEDFLTFPYQVFLSQFQLILCSILQPRSIHPVHPPRAPGVAFVFKVFLLAADMFPTAKPVVHQPKEIEGGEQQEKRVAGAISVIHLQQRRRAYCGFDGNSFNSMESLM